MFRFALANTLFLRGNLKWAKTVIQSLPQWLLAKNLEILKGCIFLNLAKPPTNSLQKETWNMWKGFKNFLPGTFLVLPDCWDIISPCLCSSEQCEGVWVYQTSILFECTCYCNNTLFLVTAYLLSSFQIVCDILEIQRKNKSYLFSHSIKKSLQVELTYAAIKNK